MRKKFSDECIELIHYQVALGYGIVSSNDISKAVHLSKHTVKNYMPEVLKRYDDIEAVNGIGYRKKGVEYSYQISANLYSYELNDYIYHWDGPTYKRWADYDKAWQEWSTWYPSKRSLKKQVAIWFKEHPNDELDIEIGLWDANGVEASFYNEVINH